MITHRNGIHAVLIQVRGNVRCDAVAARGILGVGNNDIQLMCLPEFGEKLIYCPSAGTADDVSNEQYFHPESLNREPSIEMRTDPYYIGVFFSLFHFLFVIFLWLI